MTERPRLNGEGAGAARAIPLGDDWVTRRLRAQDQRTSQNLASMRHMVEPLAEAVAAAEGALAGVQGALAAAQQAIADVAAAQATLTALVAAQVVPGRFSASASAWSTAGGYQTLAQTTLTTPTGFTRALLSANGYARIVNTSGGSAGVDARCVLAGAAGDPDSLFNMDPADYGTLGPASSALVTGLSGGSTVFVATQVNTPSAWPAHVNNLARISGTVLWLR